MPELPEVEVVRRSLEPHLLGRHIERVEVRCATLREPLDAGALSAMVGARIAGLGRRAKYLLLHLEDGRTLVVHLGMSGRLTLAETSRAEEPHEHVAVFLDADRKLRFRDPRRFGLVFVVPTSRLGDDPHFAHLGIEPFAPGFTGAFLKAAARGRRGPVKSFLMDARVVVGVGNIYASEALFRCGMHPSRSVGRISLARWELLAGACVEVLRAAIAEGGTTLNDFADGGGESGYFQVSLEVYGREGEPCSRCGGRVRRIIQSGRSSYYCPGCQH